MGEKDTQLSSCAVKIPFLFMEKTYKCAKNLVKNKEFWDDNYMKLALYPVDGSRGSLNSLFAISTP